MSPIKRLLAEASFPRLGRLKKGAPKGNGTIGADLDYFRFVGDRPEIEQAFEDAYGAEPAILSVYLPYPTPDQCFEFWSEKWDASGLVHRCDGETMVIWREGDKYVRGEKPCPYVESRESLSDADRKKDPPCEPRGRLAVILPELIRAGFVGFVSAETGSDLDILHIQKVLKATYETKQDLRGVRFTVRRQLENITIPGFGDRKGKRSRADKWLVRIEPDPDWIQLQIEMAHAGQMGGRLPEGNPTTTFSDGSEADVVTGEIVSNPAPAPAPASKPASAQIKQAQPSKAKSGNGKPPTADELGTRLWPGGKWDEVKGPLSNACKPPYTLLGALQTRDEGIRTLAGWNAHVSKAWPGYEALSPAIWGRLGEDFDRYTVLRGIAKAAEKAQDDWTNDQYLAVILAELEIPEGF